MKARTLFTDFDREFLEEREAQRALEERGQMSLFEGVKVGHDGTRREADYYPTPAWCTAALLPVLERRIEPGPGRCIIEPGIGHGAVAGPLVAAGYGVHGVDVRPEAVAECKSVGLSAEQADFMTWTPEGPVAGIVGNPPYSLAFQFVKRALLISEHCPTPPGVDRPVVAFLLALDFLASMERAAFWRDNPADILVLDRRPSFTGDGKSAFAFYAWFIWPAWPIHSGRILRCN